MHMTGRILVIAALLVGLASNAWADPLLPGQLFAGKLLNVRAPNSAGWRLVKSQESGLAFARSGSSSNESYVAQVSIFALAESNSPEEFVALIRKGAEADAPPDRFKNLESSYEYTNQRGYDCVKVVGVTEDTEARTSLFKRESLKLQVISLYCRHPKEPGAAFMAGLSHRGKTLDSDLRPLAESFIDGVQVAEQTREGDTQSAGPVTGQSESIQPNSPPARIVDSAIREDGGRSIFFILNAVDGEPVAENAMTKSIRANALRGRNLLPLPVDRYVAAGKHRLTITAQYGTAAPIEYLVRPSSFAKVSGDVEVELKPDVVYQIAGVLEPTKREVWIEEWGSHVRVGPKIIDAEVAAEAAKSMAGAKFICCNLHHNGDWIDDTNATTLPMIPAGTPIVIKDVGSNRSRVLIDARPMRIGHDYGRKQESNEQFIAKLVVDEDPRLKIKSFPESIQGAILKGKVCRGMSREQVIIALSYPRTDETSDLAMKNWKYWTADGEEYVVVWGDDGLVQEISGSEQAISRVVLPQ
jgi:hypothetical protein